jgi:hypothetical protein
VDPANRLVADTLEKEWNQRLLDLRSAHDEYETHKPSAFERRSTLEQIRDVVTHLREYWYSDSVTVEDKKELLRCLIEQIFLENGDKLIHAQVCWYGGSTSQLDVPKYLFSSPYLYHQVSELSRTHTDNEIAMLLNEKGIKTVKGKDWTVRRVMDFRLSNGISSGFTTAAKLRIPDSGYISSREAANELGVTQGTIQRWYKLGILTGKHDGGQSQLWIRWTEDVAYRLNGNAAPDSRMVQLRSLCRSEGKEWDKVLEWACKNGHSIYRLRRGKKMLFYIVPRE